MHDSLVNAVSLFTSLIGMTGGNIDIYVSDTPLYTVNWFPSLINKAGENLGEADLLVCT